MAKDCVEEVMKGLGNTETATILKGEIEKIVSRMRKERAKAFVDGILNPESAYREKALEILNRERINTKIDRIKTLENIEKRKRADLRIKERPNAVEGISVLNVGDNKRVGSNRFSAYGIQDSLKKQLMASIIKEVRATGYEDLIKGSQVDSIINRDVMIEVSELNKKNGNFGVTNSKEAMALAKAIHKGQKLILGVLNSSGAYIRELEGYAGRVTHDSVKLQKIGKEQWIDSILPLLDHEKTFNSDLIDADPVEFLSTVYDDIVTGQSSRRKRPDVSSDKLIRISGMPPNYSSRVERSRVLHFLDAAAEHTYLKQFGSGKNLFEDTISFAQRAAKDAGLMQVYGTNPGATYATLLDSYGISKDAAAMEILDAQFKELTGETLRPGSSPKAVIGMGARALMSASKLGNSVISSITDLGVRANDLVNFSGENYFSSKAKVIKSLIEALDPKNRQQVTDLIGATIDSYIHSFYAQAGAADFNGGIAKAMDLYFKANLQTYWTNWNKSAQAMIHAAEMGMRSSSAFSALDETFVNNLKRFGIGEAEWGFIQSAAKKADDGRVYVGFQDIYDMDDGLALEIAKKAGLIKDNMTPAAQRRAANKAKFDAATKLSVYYNDQIGTSVLEPTARERRIIYRGTSQDTWAGQALRLIGQFKMFPTSMVTQVLEGTLYAKGATSVKEGLVGPTSNKAGLVRLMVDLTVLSYGGMVLKDVLMNKTPKDPRDPEVMMEAFTRAGVGGIYSDMLTQEFDSRYGRGALSYLTGPTIGQLDDIGNLKTDIQKWATGRRKKFPTNAAVRLGTNNLPGFNLFYLKGAINHLFLYDLSERMNPGYMKRMEARMKKKGQGFIIKP